MNLLSPLQQGVLHGNNKKKINKTIPVVLRSQHIIAVKIIWCAAANQNEKNGGTSDNMRVVLNVCYK